MTFTRGITWCYIIISSSITLFFPIFSPISKSSRFYT
nr:MAG TPA: hypothetical protein [Bacteriophage sp.]